MTTLVVGMAMDVAAVGKGWVHRYGCFEFGQQHFPSPILEGNGEGLVALGIGRRGCTGIQHIRGIGPTRSSLRGGLGHFCTDPVPMIDGRGITVSDPDSVAAYGWFEWRDERRRQGRRPSGDSNSSFKPRSLGSRTWTRSGRMLMRCFPFGQGRTDG